MKIKKIFLFISSIFLLTSCMFTEEIYINNNGSGKYSFKIDMGDMMKSMGDMSAKDSLKKPEVLDTIVFFKDILEENKDSISKLTENDKEIIEAIKDLKLHMHVDEAKNEMLMDFNMDFNDISELKNMEQKIAKAQALNDKKKKDKSIPSNSDVSYIFKDKTFSRNVSLKDLSEDQLNEIKQASSFLEGGLYKIIYHFESEIKSVSFKDAQLSQDKKTMTIEIPMDSIMKHPKLLDFEVKLK